ncbi:MAG: DNA polymerase III subunit epsilon [Pseudomonadota bacterium]
MRQVVLDTETTGLETELGHRVIEVGCLEIINRRVTGSSFHRYLDPEREIDFGAGEVHGLTQEFLADKPKFSDIAQEMLEYIRGAELIIHNAPFDVGFLNAELDRLPGGSPRVEDICTILDTLPLAREMHPGQKNGLDALCKRYEVDNSRRELHGALLDAELLAEVYLAMTGGQTSLFLGGADGSPEVARVSKKKEVMRSRETLLIIRPDNEEQGAHERFLDLIERESGDVSLWRHQEQNPVEKVV